MMFIFHLCLPLISFLSIILFPQFVLFIIVYWFLYRLFLFLTCNFNLQQVFQKHDDKKLLLCVMKIGFGLQPFRLNGNNIIQDSCLEDVIDGPQVYLLPINHRQDLPVAPPISRDSSEICSTVEIIIYWEVFSEACCYL